MSFLFKSLNLNVYHFQIEIQVLLLNHLHILWTVRQLETLSSRVQSFTEYGYKNRTKNRMFCCGDILLIVLLYCMLGVDLENAYWTIALSAFNVGSKTRPSQVKSSQAKPNQVKSYHTAQKPGMRDMERWSFVNEFVSLRFIIFDRHAVIDVYRHQSFQLFWIYLSNVSGALFQILHHRKCIEKQNITISIAPKRKKKKKRNKNHTKIDSLLRESTHFYLYLCMCVITNASPSFEKIKTWN